MRFPRSAGILLHPTALPNPHGIGELDQAAYDFVDWLARAGQTVWQVMPLGPTGYGDSPYQSFSAFAGNPLLISLDALVGDGDLQASDLADVPAFPTERVDYGWVIQWKLPLLRQAALWFKVSSSPARRDEFHRFCDEQASWLDDYALFAALKHHFNGAVWNTWPSDIALRKPEALREWHKQLGDEALVIKYAQWQFFRQWHALKAYANQRGIKIIGDVPIFVAYDSADVWAHPELFQLDKHGKPTVVAGVPPDYFSQTGQLWGNPLYRWEVLAKQGYAWWIDRVRATLHTVDIIRLDHFRGFEAYWEVPANAQTAEKGRWVKGPGRTVFDALHKALGELPIIAEDLGVITPAVRALRDACGFPGMRVLQFAFSSNATDPFLPHNYTSQCVVYTGTHDNDTAMGWLAHAKPYERKAALAYLGTAGADFAWDLMRLAHMSVADTCIVPLQDVLSLGSEARMNFPSTASGNWQWRMRADALAPERAARLRALSIMYGRFADPNPADDEE
jgi:4-alpha-glucanotransferase